MINHEYQKVSSAQVAAAAGMPASIISDVSGRRGALDGRIRTMVPGARLCGPALTVEVRPGDNLMIHAALVLAQAGDVLVIDGKGCMTSALMGELMCAHAQAAGIAGVVIDGAVRDVAELRVGDLPVFACGSSPNGPTRGLAGRIGYPVSVGGVSIMPGDLMLGDDDGVVTSSREGLDQILALASRKIAAEAQRLQDIGEGRLVYGWLEGALKDVGALSQHGSLQALVSDFSGSPDGARH